MPSTGLLTSDYLDSLGRSMFRVDRPRETAAELRDAVDQGRVADEADTGYALMLAAEFSERAGDLPAAEVLAGRAIEVNDLQGDLDSYPRAFRAELLLRLGRADDAMAELTALRPLMSEDHDAVSYVTDALETSGRAEIAEQWLTEALYTALPRQQESGGDERATTAVLTLAQHRHRLRRNLDLPHDELDQLAERMMSVLQDVPAEDALDDEPGALLFWSPLEFDRLLLRWPGITESLGLTWEDYRALLEQLLVLASESGVAGLGLLTASVDELVTYADCGGGGGDPPDPQVFQGYARHLAELNREISWPPGRNEACWCGSSLEYQECCLPRSCT